MVPEPCNGAAKLGKAIDADYPAEYNKINTTLHSPEVGAAELPHNRRPCSTMRRIMRNTLFTAACVLTIGLFANPNIEGLSPNPACEDVDLRILPDRTSYPPGATMRVKLLVTNIAQTPFYLFRGIGQCTSWRGSLSLDLRDQNNHEVEYWGCSVDEVFMDTVDVVQVLSDSKAGAFLQQNEIYGAENEYKLPNSKGTFLLHAELVPIGYLTDEQKRALVQHQMRVLDRTCEASPVKITIK